MQGAPVKEFSEAEAAARGEERVHIVEDREYEYAIKGTDVPLNLVPNEIVKPSRLGFGDVETGRIKPGSRTGLLRLDVTGPGGTRFAPATLEVVSSKLTYRSDYRTMLERIASISADLAIELREPVGGRFKASLIHTLPSLQQRFEILRGLIGGDSLQQAIALIVARPHTVLVPTDDDIDIRRGLSGRQALPELASSAERIALLGNHPAYVAMAAAGIAHPSLPARVSHASARWTVDSPENRFVKFALETYLDVFTDLALRFRAQDGIPARRLVGQTESVVSFLSQILQSPMFGEVGRLTYLSEGSPVLQRRAGYREFLSSWIRFNSALDLQWAGAEDIVGAGKMRMGLLYESWCFIEVIQLLRSSIGFNWRTTDLLERKPDGLGLKLSSGTGSAIAGQWLGPPRLTLRVDYNRLFPAKAPPAAAGSWSLAAKPDITLSCWPHGLLERDAEVAGKIVRFHFDAKYRADSLVDLFSAAVGDNQDDDDAGQVAGMFKKADMWKMHFYRDAIRGSSGAVVLYPGNETRIWNRRDGEASVGVIAFRPTDGQAPKGTDELQTWVKGALRAAASELN